MTELRDLQGPIINGGARRSRVSPLTNITQQDRVTLLAHIEALQEENALLRHEADDTDKEIENLHCFWPRLRWLVGLLLFQSLSSIVLKSFHDVMVANPSIVYFLTMLVGAGGNVGGQSVVLVVRALATNRPAPSQALDGLKLGFFLALATLGRTLLQGVDMTTANALTAAMFAIVITASTMGQFLPVCFRYLGIDPAHSSAAIQVIMDVTGITLTCVIASWMLALPDGPEGPVPAPVPQLYLSI